MAKGHKALRADPTSASRWIHPQPLAIYGFRGHADNIGLKNEPIVVDPYPDPALINSLGTSRPKARGIVLQRVHTCFFDDYPSMDNDYVVEVIACRDPQAVDQSDLGWK